MTETQGQTDIDRRRWKKQTCKLKNRETMTEHVSFIIGSAHFTSTNDLLNSVSSARIITHYSDNGRKSFRWETHMMFFMIKTGIFEAYGRFIISCYKLPDKGKDRIYRGKKERETIGN